MKFVLSIVLIIIGIRNCVAQSVLIEYESANGDQFITLYEDNSFQYKDWRYVGDEGPEITKGTYSIYDKDLKLYDSLIFEEESYFQIPSWSRWIPKDSIYIHFEDFFHRPISEVETWFIEAGKFEPSIRKPDKYGTIKLKLNDTLSYNNFNNRHSISISLPNRNEPDLMVTTGLNVKYNQLNIYVSFNQRTESHLRITGYKIDSNCIVPTSSNIYKSTNDINEGSWGKFCKTNK